MTATPEAISTTETRPTPRNYLTAIAHSAIHAVELARAGQVGEANEHVDAIERLIAAYRTVSGGPEPADRHQVVGIELVVQVLDHWGAWRSWAPSIPGLFEDEGRRQLAQARTGFPDRKFRLVRRTESMTVEDLTDTQTAGSAS